MSQGSQPGLHRLHPSLALPPILRGPLAGWISLGCCRPKTLTPGGLQRSGGPVGHVHKLPPAHPGDMQQAWDWGLSLNLPCVSSLPEHSCTACPPTPCLKTLYPPRPRRHLKKHSHPTRQWHSWAPLCSSGPAPTPMPTACRLPCAPPCSPDCGSLQAGTTHGPQV